MTNNKYINIKEVVELTGHPTDELRKLAQTGVLPAHKTRRGHWRLNVSDVEKYFDIQINKPAEVDEKPAPKVMPRAARVQPRFGEVVSKPASTQMYKSPAGTHLVVDDDHYQEVIDRICAADSSIRLMTGDFNLFKLKSDSKQRKNYKDGTPFIKYLMEKAKQGVSVQIILSDPTKNVEEELKEFYRQRNSYPFCTRNCIRNHAKVAIIDDKIAYMGSANATRAGLGQYKPGNFEAGILTEDPALVSSINELFTKIWDGDYCEGCYRKKDCVEY